MDSTVVVRTPLFDSTKPQPHFAIKNDRNTIAGFIDRHAGHSDYPDAKVVKRYAASVRQYLDELVPVIAAHKWIPFSDFLEHVEPKKRVFYIKGYREYYTTRKLDMAVEIMQKAKEMSYKPIPADTPYVNIGREKVWLTDAIAPRNLQNPSPSVKAILGWLAYNVLQIITKHPDPKLKVNIGKNNEQLQHQLNE